jgi:2-polyprenyl-3-methyl-5-hydroxy-6-metoxy-1,4-benzoquinol methylase
MLSFKNRTYQKEFLDSDAISFEDIKQNMKELNTINSLLGGHAITIAGIRKILTQKSRINVSSPIVVCEIGCGGGDNINAIYKWANKNKLTIQFIGIDIKKECIDFAKQQYPLVNAQWIASAYEDVVFDNKPTIIFSSLFCHHFTNEQLVRQLQWLKQNCTTGFFINDLHRHKIAYFLIKWLTKFFSKSYLVKNDAPLSVARGFIKKEWCSIFLLAAIKQYSIQWKWAFRHLIVFTNE